MTHVPDTVLQEDLSRYLDAASEGQAPIVITRGNGKGSVVLMSEAEFAGWQETAHLLSSPANAERLRQALREVDAQQWVKENRAAMDAWNAHVEEHGLPLAEYRNFDRLDGSA